MRILFFDIGEIDYKGIEILSAILKEKGHTVDLLLDPGLGKHYYLKIPLLNLFVGDSMLLKKLISFKPDLIAMSIVTNNFQYFRSFGLKIKAAVDVPIIVGGIHPTSVPEEVIKESWVDILCIGDGEEAMLELLEKMENKQDIKATANLWVKDKEGTIFKNYCRPLENDLDKHPFPDRSIYAQYGALSKRIRFMTGRGCPHHCTFCVNSFRKGLYQGQKYLRKRSVEKVIAELEMLIKTYSPKAIRFEDDVFVLDKTWFSQFKTEYTKKIHLPFHCYITPNGVNEEIISGLKECGCQSIAMGIQSGNEELRSRIMKRFYTNDKVIEAAQLIKKYGIKLYAEYMFGFPEETPDMMHDTLMLSDAIKADNSWAGIFYPYPKIELTQYCIENNYIDGEVYKRIISGYGSPHTASVLNHNYKTEALKYKIILPVYSQSFKPIKYILKKLLKIKYCWLHKTLYILSIPLLEKKEFFYRVIRLPLIIYKTYKALNKHST